MEGHLGTDKESIFAKDFSAKHQTNACQAVPAGRNRSRSQARACWRSATVEASGNFIARASFNKFQFTSKASCKPASKHRHMYDTKGGPPSGVQAIFCHAVVISSITHRAGFFFFSPLCGHFFLAPWFAHPIRKVIYCVTFRSNCLC